MSETSENVLSKFKQKAQITDVLPVLDDEIAQKVLIAWQRITIIRHDDPDPIFPDDENGQWKSLWQGVQWDYRELSEVSGVVETRLRQKIGQLKGNRLIFPDGSVSGFARKYIETRVASEVRRLKS